MSNANDRRRIREILTEAERERIVDQAVIANPLMRGARYDDVLDMAWDTDAYVSATEPFFDVNRGWPKVAAYAAMVICAQGRPLTPLALAEVMSRAGLLPADDGEDLRDKYRKGDLVEFAGDGISYAHIRRGVVERILMADQKNPLLVIQAADMPGGITIMRQASAVQMLQQAPREN